MVGGRLSSRLAGLLLFASPAIYAQGAGQTVPPGSPPDPPPPVAAASAPTQGAAANSAPPPSGSATPTQPSADGSPAAKPDESAKPQAPKVPMTGYGWTDDAKPPPPPPAAPRKHPHPAAHAPGPGVVRPGFEMLADGSSRLFVELSQAVAVDEKRGKRELTYVLKGAHVEKRNNYNPLVTLHFNSPVTRARLLPHGKDLWFTVELRADATPSWKMTAAKEGMQILQIEFPKGDFLPHAPPAKTGTPAKAPAADENPGG